MSKKKKSHASKHIYVSDFVTDNNYIFYERLFTSNGPQATLWDKIGRQARDDFNANIDLLNVENNRNMIADVLLTQAAAEKKKEINFLKEVFGVDDTTVDLEDYPTLINKLNRLIGLKDEYKNLLTVLNQGRGDTENQIKKARGYGAAAYFGDYFAKHLYYKLLDAMESQEDIDIITKGKKKEYNKLITRLIEESVEDTIREIAEIQGETVDDEEVHVWNKLLHILEETEEDLYGNFKNDFYKRYHLSNVKKEVRAFLKDRAKRTKSSKQFDGLETKIKKSYKLSEGAIRAAEGFLEEYLQTGIIGNIIINDGKAVFRKGTVVKSNIAKTDTVSLYTANVNFDLDPLIDELNSRNHFESLMDAQNYLNSFNNKLQSMPDNFVVYENVKKYATNSDNFRGFHGGKVNVRDLHTMFKKTRNQIDVDKLMATLLNTVDETVISDGKKTRKDLTYALSSSVATFLFDDWESIGNVDNEHALHIFILDAVRVPLSYFLYALGTAIKDAQKDPTSLVKFDFSIKPILYPYPIGSQKSGIAFEPAGGIKKYWDKQREYALDNSNFTITFMENFNRMIIQLLERID